MNLDFAPVYAPPSTADPLMQKVLLGAVKLTRTEIRRCGHKSDDEVFVVATSTFEQAFYMGMATYPESRICQAFVQLHKAVRESAGEYPYRPVFWSLVRDGNVIRPEAYVEMRRRLVRKATKHRFGGLSEEEFVGYVQRAKLYEPNTERARSYVRRKVARPIVREKLDALFVPIRNAMGVPELHFVLGGAA